MTVDIPPSSVPSDSLPEPLPPHRKMLYTALLERDGLARDSGANTATMYLGAMRVLGQSNNPDRVALAAHGLRELMEKLPRFVDVPVAQGAGLTGRVVTLVGRWRRATRARTAAKERRVGEFHAHVEEFAVWFETQHTSRKERAAELLVKLDQRKIPLPAAIRKSHVQIWDDCHRYFEGVAHHGKSNVEEFPGYLDAFETFLMDRLRPRTVEDQRTIDERIAEAERDA